MEKIITMAFVIFCILYPKSTNSLSTHNPRSVYDKNPYCAVWLKGRCKKCSYRSYFNKKGICTIVDPNCENYNKKSGKCYSCYKGFELRGRIC